MEVKARHSVFFIKTPRVCEKKFRQVPRFGISIPYFVANGMANLTRQATQFPVKKLVKGENYYQKV